MTKPEDMAFPISGFYPGLSKREHFAAMAMNGLLSNQDHSSESWNDQDQIAEKALSMADELIKSLNEQEIK